MNDIHTSTLDCGATLAVEPIDGVRSAAISLLLASGNAYDPSNAIGRAALWSEILLRGAGAHDARAQADLFDRLGASRSSDAGRVMFRIGASMLGERLADAIKPMAEMVLEPRFDAEAVENARELSYQAIESLRDDPQHRAVLSARERHFAVPYNRSGYGLTDHIRAMSRDDLRDGWMRSASPRGAVIGVAGAVDHERVRAQLNDALGSWLADGERIVPGDAPPRGYAHEDDDSNQAQIIIVHDAPYDGHDDRVLERLLTSVLSGGMSSRLFTEVREKRGLCYSVSASYTAEKAFGSVSAYVGTTPERAQESLDVLHAELVRIGTAEGAVTAEEFERARTGLKSRLVFAGESTSARAAAIAGDIARIGRARSLGEFADELDRVTLDRLNEYAQRRELGRLTVQTLGPAALRPPAGVAEA
ncbi:MAG: peptidase M16 [Phycisphaerae bacterium]|nr:peptidase M16 [Phycisphaerae bacterium]